MGTFDDSIYIMLPGLSLVAISGLIFCWGIAAGGLPGFVDKAMSALFIFGLTIATPFGIVAVAFALAGCAAALCIGAVGLTLVGTFKAALWGYAKLREAF